VNLNKSLADELNQPTCFRFPTVRPSKKKSKKPNKPNKDQNRTKPPKNSGLGFFKKAGFFLNPGIIAAKS